MFGPYTPLQQLDILADFGTKSYIVGSTNSLLLQQKDRYSDILINLDEDTVSITSSSLRSALALTAADRRWIDNLTHEVNETWDDSNPSQPKTMQYQGSEESIRKEFEAYILGLISSVKYHNFIVSNPDNSGTAEPDPALDFGLEWIEAWSKTENYRMWNSNTDVNLFAVSEPKHPCAGGLTIDDVQRRIADQVKDLHLDERFAAGREVLGRNFAAGREKATGMLNRLYSDMEYLRESQRRRAEDAAKAQEAKSPTEKSTNTTALPAVDLQKASQAASTAGQRASAYMSSWATWAGEKRKTGGWGAGWGRKPSSKTEGVSSPTSPVDKSDIDKDYHMVSKPGSRATSEDASRHAPQASFSESILSGVSSSPGRPRTGDDEAALQIRDLDAERKEKDTKPAVEETKEASTEEGKQEKPIEKETKSAGEVAKEELAEEAKQQKPVEDEKTATPEVEDKPQASDEKAASPEPEARKD